MAVIDTLITSALNTVVKLSGAVIGTRRGLNFIEGTNISLTVADDPTNNAVNVTIDATGPAPVSSPTGAITQYAAATAPSGWLLCNGATVGRIAQASLFAIIGTTYGVGDGSTTFNVPDMRGRIPVGYAVSGGHADVSTLGNNDGTALANRRPKHRHTPHLHTGGMAIPTGSGSGGAGGAAANTGLADGGTGVATDPLDAPAYLVTNYIIKT